MADDDADETPIAAAQAASTGPKDVAGRNRKLLTGAAIGIGSAALVAALLYANRRRSDRT